MPEMISHIWLVPDNYRSIIKSVFMKQSLFVMLTVISVITTIVFVQSCKHEGLDACATNPIALSYTKTSANVGKNDGSIQAVATGGQEFTFSLNGAPFQTSGSFTGLKGGIRYSLVVRNSWGCADSATIDIGNINVCNGVTIGVTAKIANATVGKSDGSITAAATGGTGFTYKLNNGTFQAGNIFTGLTAGIYTITAKSSTGCIGTTQATIAETNPCTGVTVTVNTTLTNPVGTQKNGSIKVSATGGTGFMYKLDNGVYQTSNTFSGLAAGSYVITAKNANGCTGSKTVVLGSNNPCTGVTITVTTTLVNPALNQNNGSITTTASGGTGFTYSLNNGTFQASGTFSGLAAGTYTVTAKSSTGCLGTKQVTLASTNPCTNSSLNLNTTAAGIVPCSTPATNGSITVTASGSSGYTYNINGGAYQSGNIFNSLAAGTYTMGVKDINGCTKTTSVTVGTAAPGTSFSAVKTLLINRCSGSGCHVNGGSAAGYNFDTDCGIINDWQKIQSAAVTRKSMPISPQAKLTAAEMKLIDDWVAGGHTYKN